MKSSKESRWAKLYYEYYFTKILRGQFERRDCSKLKNIKASLKLQRPDKEFINMPKREWCRQRKTFEKYVTKLDIKKFI